MKILFKKKRKKYIIQPSKDCFKHALPCSLKYSPENVLKSRVGVNQEKLCRSTQLLIQSPHLGFQSYTFKLVETSLVQAPCLGAGAGAQLSGAQRRALWWTQGQCGAGRAGLGLAGPQTLQNQSWQGCRTCTRSHVTRYKWHIL